MLGSALERYILRRWYSKRPGWLLLLWPLSVLFRWIGVLRKAYLSRQSEKPTLPVIIVGNITVGGTGKSPVVIALVHKLRQLGYVPGVITRGYGAHVEQPYHVTEDSLAEVCGDEPLMIYEACQCPVIVSPNRLAAAQKLEQLACSVIISDDGLQHYGLGRDIEIAVIDQSRGFGNGFLLPVGPLREPVNRLRDVDYRLINGTGDDLSPCLDQPVYAFKLQASYFVNVKTSERLSIAQAKLKFGQADTLHALAGIGNPQRFFQTLRHLGFSCKTYSFSDHKPFTSHDLAFAAHSTLFMTMKDAVKCRAFASINWWALAVSVELPDAFSEQLSNQLNSLAV